MSERLTLLGWIAPQERFPRNALPSLGYAFQGQILSFFGETILPHSFGTELTSDEIGLYMTKRIAAFTDPLKTCDIVPNNFFEEYFHGFFWPSEAESVPLMFLVGREGVGKSTLLRYYFDYYLPNYPDFPHGKLLDVDKHEMRKQLASHLVIHVDLRRREPVAAIRKRICETIVQYVRSRLPNLSSEDDFAMWDRLADWATDHHLSASKAYASVTDYRASLTAPHLLNHETFANEALWYLCNRCENKWSVSIILDNIDQQDLPVQLDILQLALSWLGDRVFASPFVDRTRGHGYDLWRVIIPVRPETLATLSNDLHPLDKKAILFLPALDQELLLKNRSEKLHEAVGNSRQQVPVDVPFEHDGMVCCLLPNTVATERLQRLLSIKTRVDDPEDELIRLVPSLCEDTCELIRLFCNGSNRRFFRLRKRLIVNPGLSQEFMRPAQTTDAEQDAANDSHIVSRYRFVSAWLHGAQEYFDEDDPDNDVLNLYHTTRTLQCAHAILVGPFVLDLLRHDYLTRSAIVDNLRGIGFKVAEVEACLQAMHAKYFFRYVDVPAGSSGEFIAEKDILDAHWELLASAAYTDAMSLVTFVPRELLESKEVSFSHYYETSQFLDRTRTSLAFLVQLKEDEELISTWCEGADRTHCDWNSFEKHFRALQLPSIYRYVAEAYVSRLEALRKKKRMMITEDAWEDLLGRRICQYKNYPRMLEPHKV